MSLSQRERDADRAKWRRLTQLSTIAAHDPASTLGANNLAVSVGMARDFVMPVGERPEDLKCVALIHVAKAYVHQPNGEARRAMSAALREIAAAVGDMLDATDPAARAPAADQPLRRHRADIDD